MNKNSHPIIFVILTFGALLGAAWMFLKSPVAFNASYEVDSAGNLKLRNSHVDKGANLSEAQVNIDIHHNIWNRFRAMYPERLSNHVKCFIAKGSRRDKTAGFVRHSHRQDGYCLAMDVFYVAPGGNMDETRRDSVLNHEYGHLLMLHPNQFKQSARSNACVATQGHNGCPTPESYFAQFWDKFWAPYPDLRDSVKAKGTPSREMLRNRAQVHKDHFISLYAATNVKEDFAESWETFVMRDKPTKTDSIAAQKILFFHQFAELVEIRDAVRKVMSQ